MDLSPEGMLVLSDESVAHGEKMIVSFMATEIGVWFDTMASVARIVEGRRNEDRGRRALGLTFTSLPAVSRLILRGNLRKIPPPLPRRPRVRVVKELFERAPFVDYAAIVRDIAAGMEPRWTLTSSE